MNTQELLDYVQGLRVRYYCHQIRRSSDQEKLKTLTDRPQREITRDDRREILVLRTAITEAESEMARIVREVQQITSDAMRSKQEAA